MPCRSSKEEDMERRELLVRMGGLLLVLPASRVLLGCGSSSGGQTLTYTTSSELDHTHTVALEVTDLTAPPANGVDKTTSNVLSHTHTVALSEAELTSIEGGTSVTKTTSMDDNHTHTVTFFKM
jgi:hypothetical protein